jgi:site-specific DNA-methyltransferase (adenine-specific)
MNTCAKCGKEFSRKAGLAAHMKRVRPCDGVVAAAAGGAGRAPAAPTTVSGAGRAPAAPTAGEGAGRATQVAPMLIHGDCLKEMKAIPANSVDMILVDLPYGMTKNAWDTVLPFEAMWAEYERMIKPNGAIVLFANNPFGAQLICSNLALYRYSLVWEKNKFSDFLNAKRKPMKIHEDLHVFYKAQPTYNPQYTKGDPYERWNTQAAVDSQTNYGSHKENHVVNKEGTRCPTTVLRFKRVERPAHPTQKPVDLLEWLIKTYTNEGELVLDSCMGVGSTGVACKNLGRRFIGMELEEEFYKAAVKRITEEETS